MHANTPFSSSPPSGYQRGMYVGDCDYLIEEIYLNNDVVDFVTSGTSATPLTNELLHYCIDNHIDYIAAYKLASANNVISSTVPVLGNKPYYPAIRNFLNELHSHNIQIGVVFSSRNFADNYILPFLETNCLPTGCAVLVCPGLERNYFYPNGIPDDWINPEDNETRYDILERADYIRQILNYAEYTATTISDVGFEAESMYYHFDWLSLEFEFWNPGAYNKLDDNNDFIYPPSFPPSGGTITPARIMYNNFIHITEALHDVSQWFCNVPMEMEIKFALQDHNYYNSTGWPSPNQYQPESDAIAAYIDELYDRFHYVSPTANPSALFDKSCEAFYHLGLTSGNSDHSRIWPLAYASRAATATQPLIPKNVWGDTIGNGNYEAAGYYNYLNNKGDTGPQVNFMNGPEANFKSDFNAVAATYQCADCITNDYQTISQVYSHFSSGDYSTGDSYSDGVMWFCYGLLNHPRHPYIFYRNNKNNETAFSFEPEQQFASPIPCDDYLVVNQRACKDCTYKLMDVQGKSIPLNSYGEIISTEKLMPGVYTIVATDEKGKVQRQKISINHLK